jgi:putative transcriptional regulator
MNDIMDLTNHFLIAMPQLADPNFFQSVTYICEHNADGTMGLIINRPTEMTLGDIFNHLEIDNGDTSTGQQPVYFGGPVHQDRGFVLHTPSKNWNGTLFVSDDIAVTASSDILTDMAHAQGPKKSLVTLGYAGWGPGQLEEEIRQNSWLSVPATAEIIFDLPHDKRWAAAATLLGIDLTQLSGQTGHA